MNSINQRISSLRQLMREYNLQAYIVPGTDPHASEYMASHWMETTWISGFKGETGTVVVTLDHAFLWTDSRYYLQAEKELAGSEVGLMKESEVDTPSIPEWLCSVLAQGSKVGVNAEMFSQQAYVALADTMREKQIALVSVDLIRPLWVENRPAIPDAPLYPYLQEYAGESVESKFARVRAGMQRYGASVLVLSALDEIAWLLNIRGTDVEYNPVVIGYAVLEMDKCTLFVNPRKVDAEAAAYLQEHNIARQDYDAVYNYLHTLTGKTVLFDGTRLNRALWEAIADNCPKVDKQSPVLLLKSRKNDVELQGERIAMRRDAVALTRFFLWLEKTFGTQTLTEYDLMQKLHEFRAAQEHFVEESFCTIAGFRGNGAIVHYQATADDCAEVSGKGVLLLDSGGQYLEGTTDITRTVWLGEIPQPGTAEETSFRRFCHDFTLVLKGHIALACARFPRGTRGNQVDILARQYMWQEGLSFGHGTGHGVGHFLGCHEGPQNIRTDNNPTSLEEGMICSDEPGLYRSGEYGIRTENLITVVPVQKTDFGEFLGFEVLTLCYYDTRLIEKELLTRKEIAWINAYHQRVLQEITPLLTPEEAHWLQAKCETI
ncbi:MAG TPA: peptidase M24 [Bacteroidales bacterium]|nr:peptidase M24 [Bacteroidales bacterium]